MQDYNTIIGVIQMRQNECPFDVIQARYHIGSGTTQRILKRFAASGTTLEELRAMSPHEVEKRFYPPENLHRKKIPLPDFQYYYDRIHAKGSKVNGRDTGSLRFSHSVVKNSGSFGYSSFNPRTHAFTSFSEEETFPPLMERASPVFTVEFGASSEILPRLPAPFELPSCEK